jgi:quercetin dioxygenase-like cupin family protein
MTTIAPLHYSRSARPDNTRNLLGARFTFLADAEQTRGAYAVMDTTARRGAEPPPHRHANEDEAYYVLDGAWTFHCESQDTAAHPGSFVFLPRGFRHHFTLRSEVGRALLIVSPGGLERCFRQLSAPMDDVSQLPPMAEGAPPVELVVGALSDYGVSL